MNMHQNEPYSSEKLDQLIEDIHSLLNGLDWNTGQPRYLTGQQARILLQSRAAPETGHHAALITVTSIEGLTQFVEGRLTIALHREGLTCFGYLNHLGQVLFSNLEYGTYRITVQRQLARRSRQAPLALTPLPRLEMAAAASTQEWQYIYRNASNTLTATLWKREQGELEIDFDARDGRWDGALVGFRWSPAADSAPQLLVAPLVWSERTHTYVAQMNLGQVSPIMDHLALPDQPIAPAALAEASIEEIRESVRRAARAQTRRAWQQLLHMHGASLPAETRAAIAEALAAFEGTF